MPDPSPRPTSGGPGRRPAGPVAACLLALTAAVGCLGGVVPAASATPRSPETPRFPPQIDPFPVYEAESGCDPAPRPGALDVQQLLRTTYGASIASNVSRPCTSANSGHEEGRAIDWMTDARDPVQKATADAFLTWLLATDEHGNRHAMARRLGVMYVIWNGRRFYLWNTALGWQQYSDCLTARTSAAHDTTCHRDHVHLSLTRAGAGRLTSWWTAARGPVACRASSPGTGTALPVERHPVRRVRATRVFDSARGIGTGAGPGTGAAEGPVPCRVAAGTSVAVRLAGQGPVPETGVAEVLVSVTASGTGVAGWVGPAPVAPAARIGALPTGRRLTVPASGSATASWTLPVGASGTVWFGAGPGDLDLRVAVVGYRLARSHPGAGWMNGGAARGAAGR